MSDTSNPIKVRIFITILVIFLFVVTSSLSIAIHVKQEELEKDSSSCQKMVEIRKRNYWEIDRDDIHEREIALQLSAKKRNYLVGEPIKLIVTLSNTSDNPIEIFESIHPGEDVIRLDIVYETGEILQYGCVMSISRGIGYDYRGRVLQPGESISEFYYPLYSRYGDPYTFGKPGEYEVRAIYKVQAPNNNFIWSGIVISNKEILSFQEAKDDDAKALELFAKASMASLFGDAYAFIVERKGDVDEKEKLQEIIDEYPKSIFMKYAKFSLAALYMGEDWDKSLQLFNELERSFSDFRKDEIRIGQIYCSYALGMPEKVEELSNYLNSNPVLQNTAIFIGVRSIMEKSGIIVPQ